MNATKAAKISWGGIANLTSVTGAAQKEEMGTLVKNAKGAGERKVSKVVQDRKHLWSLKRGFTGDGEREVEMRKKKRCKRAS